MGMEQTATIKAIIGLGNPGQSHYYQRHNIGFRIVDALADKYAASWKEQEYMLYASFYMHEKKIVLIKPQTYMNSSGKVIPWLLKQGIKAEHILVVHDELEKPFGHISIKVGGSARGHNGLRSIIGACGTDFARLRFGIGRPARKEDVADYVLQSFSGSSESVEELINKAVDLIEHSIQE